MWRCQHPDGAVSVRWFPAPRQSQRLLDFARVRRGFGAVFTDSGRAMQSAQNATAHSPRFGKYARMRTEPRSAIRQFMCVVMQHQLEP